MADRRIGLKDVARTAQVSVGTVSHVLNHPSRVSPAKREAVEAAIRELGFVRDESARHLRSGHSSTIGLLLLDAWNPGFIDMARGVEDATASSSMTLLMSNSGRSIERERASLRVFSEHRLAGAIVIPHDPLSDELHQVRTRGVPVVVLDRSDRRDGVMSVGVDDHVGGRVAAEHLIGLGHRRLAFVGDASLAIPVAERLSGAAAAVAEHDGVSLTELTCDLTTEGGRAVGDWLATSPAATRPTGIACAIDLVAIGLLQALQQHNVAVPEDISLVGYDDIAFAAQLSVPLTTVRRPHHEMGRAAVDLLTRAIAGETIEQPHLEFTPELVVRSSTAGARKGNRRG